MNETIAQLGTRVEPSWDVRTAPILEVMLRYAQCKVADRYQSSYEFNIKRRTGIPDGVFG